MTSLTDDIKDKLKKLTAFEKIILINVVIYVVGWMIWRLNTIARDRSLDWLALPKDFSNFIVKPWTIFSYGFAHIDFWHLAINMFILYFVGRSFSNLFPTKQSLNIYFLGILTGGFLFIVANLVLPNTFFIGSSGLVGASAGIHAALLFLCAYMPNYEAGLLNFKIKLWYIGVAIVVFDVLGLFGDNRGGNIAHLGGDLLGYWYAFQLKKGIDIGKGFEGFTDNVSNLFSFSKKAPLKTVHKRKKAYAGHTKQEFKEFNNQKQIDLILDKISKSGYDSLSKEEKEFLFKSGKK